MNAISDKMLEGMRSLEVEHNPDYPLDDIGIAKLFHTLCKEIACYVPEAKSWYIFDGRRWVKDNGGLSVMELCKSFVQTMYRYTGRKQRFYQVHHRIAKPQAQRIHPAGCMLHCTSQFI